MKRLSIDEVIQRKGHQDFVTVVSDIDRRLLLELIDSHKQENIIEVLRQQPFEVRSSVQKVSVDMWGGFPKVVQSVFPNAQIVFDRFHVMKPVNEELKKVRKQVKMAVQGSKFFLLKNGMDLMESKRVKLELILRHSKRLKLAYELKEESREIFENCQTVEEGREQFVKWLQKARSIYCDVITTIRNHLDGICNWEHPTLAKILDSEQAVEISATNRKHLIDILSFPLRSRYFDSSTKNFNCRLYCS